MTEPMGETTIGDLESFCRAIHSAVGRDWSWDGRFGMALMTYDKADEEAVLGGVAATLTTTWAGSDLGGAPQKARDIADSAGGIGAGQSLLHSDLDSDPILFATVWPWGNKKTISLRIGFSAPGMSDDQRVAASELLKSWFATA